MDSESTLSFSARRGNEERPYYNGRYAEAIAQLHSVLGMKSDFGLAHLWLARSYLEVGRFDQSLASTASAEAAAPGWPVLVAARGYTFGVMGRPDEARTVRDEMDRLSERRFVTAYGVALVHASLGEKEQAFGWLDKAFAERSHWLVWLRLEWRLEEGTAAASAAHACHAPFATSHSENRQPRQNP